jgi:trigger factor
MADDPTTPSPESTDPSQTQPVAEPAEQAEEQADKLEQTVKIEDAGPARKKISIDVPATRIAAKLTENFSQLQDEATVPGFRRGRAPQRLLEKRFGTEVRSEVKTQIMAESFQQVVEENDLRVLGEPDIKDADDIELPEDGDLGFEVEIEVVPEFEMPKLDDLKITKRPVEVADEQVETEIDRYRDMYGKLKNVAEPAAYEDYLTADIRIKDEKDQVLDESNNATVYVPGQSRKFKGVVAGILVEDLGKQLEGKSTNETVTIEATGPAQHENEALRDKPLKIELTIRQVERMQPMPLDELVQAMGLDSEDLLKEQVRTSLERRAESDQQNDMQQQVVDYLLDKVDFDLPEQMSQRQADRVLQRRAMDLMYRGHSQQDVEENLAELRAASQEQAQRELKQYFVLDKVASEFDVEVTPEEINGQVAQMAMQQGRRPERLREEMAKQGQLDQLFMQMRERKAIDKLIEQAEVVEADPEADDATKNQVEQAQGKSTKKKTTKKKTSKKSTESSSEDAKSE